MSRLRDLNLVKKFRLRERTRGPEPERVEALEVTFVSASCREISRLNSDWLPKLRSLMGSSVLVAKGHCPRGLVLTGPFPYTEACSLISWLQELGCWPLALPATAAPPAPLPPLPPVPSGPLLVVGSNQILIRLYGNYRKPRKIF